MGLSVDFISTGGAILAFVCAIVIIISTFVIAFRERPLVDQLLAADASPESQD